MRETRDRVREVHVRAVTKTFAFLKQTSRLDDLYARSIGLEANRGFLLPVCELHVSDEALIEDLATWREANQDAFPTRFTVTVDGTAAWLRTRLLDVPDRILFVVVDAHGNRVGHVGLAGTLNDASEVEIDNVVRGVTGVRPGIMSSALQALLDWTEEHLAPSTIALRVFRDNAHAIAFYRRLGFVDDGLLPLRRRENGASVAFEPVGATDVADPDAFFLRMVYRPRRAVDASRMILTAGPSISAREASYALDAARNGWNRQWNGYLERFERAFAEYLGVRHAIATSSCTGALHLALAALGVGPGDEVIVPDLTWVATATAVAYVGATPVFVDVQRDTWCMAPSAFEAAITRRTRAVIPVHLYGHPAPMDAIVALARAHGIAVVEDAAPAIGATIGERKVGTFGDLAAFSFQGAKLLVTGEGGMLVTNSDDLFARAESLWDQGRDPNRQFWINRLGFKYKMSNVQAAIGLGQLERVDELIEAKRRVFGWYAEALDGVPHVTLNHEARGVRSIYWMTSILLDPAAGISRDDLRAALKSRNIDTRPVFPAISQYPIWNRALEAGPAAARIGAQGINLPSGVRLRREQVEYIGGAIVDILAAAR
jgi:perosamine synthetase